MMRRQLLATVGVVLCAAAIAPTVAAAGGQIAAKASRADVVKQPCIEVGTAMPKLQENDVLRPGDYKSQTLYTIALFRPMPVQCRGVYKRHSEVRFQLQNPRKHSVWFNLGGWMDFMGEEGNIDDLGGKGRAYYAPVLEDRNPKHLYRCTPGPGKTHAKIILKSMVKSVAAGKVIARSIREVWMKVRRVRGMLKPGRGGVRGAC